MSIDGEMRVPSVLPPKATAAEKNSAAVFHSEQAEYEPKVVQLPILTMQGKRYGDFYSLFRLLIPLFMRNMPKIKIKLTM